MQRTVSRGNNKRRARRKRRIRMIKRVLFLLLVFLVVVYVGQVVYFMGHFACNTYVNGQDAYKKTPAMLEEEMLEGASGYSLTIAGRGGVTQSIGTKELSIKPQAGDQFDEILKAQNPFIWPVYLFSETHLTTENVAEYSEEDLERLVDGLAFFDSANIKPPVDAHISDEAGDDGFYVVPQDDGCSPIRSQVLSEIKAALDVFEGEIELSEECYEKAKITSEDEYLNTLCNNLNQYCSACIIYRFGDDEVRVDGTRIREWCTVDGTQVSFNEEKIKDFVNELARTYDTFGKTRHLVTHSGKTVEVSGGDYGWWMDRATETKELTEAVLAGEKGERTPVYFGTGLTYGDKDWGDSYVEINLDDQHLWVYQDGKVVEESDFVSGCVNKRRTTPVGTYAITYKERDATLVGENYSSAVKYWMPFNKNVGMHDASWRSSFGGEIYVTNGSHGCINLPTSKAAAIYDIVTKGEPVLVYGGKTLPEPEEEEEEESTELTPEQQLQLLIQAGYLNPDGTPVTGTEGAQSTPEVQPQEETAPPPAQEVDPESSQEGTY